MPPVDKQESNLTQATSLGTSDFIRIVKDLTGTPLSQVISRANFKAYLDSLYEPLGGGGTGWQSVTETWTRTGNHSFTVPNDLTAKYHKGTKVRYKDGGSFEYGVVRSVSFSAPNTTVNLVVNTDYLMASGTITETSISYQENPQSWPNWFNFSPTLYGYSVAPTGVVTRWNARGTTIRVYGRAAADGTSNSVNHSMDAPVAAKTLTNAFWMAPLAYRDNSVTGTNSGAATINSADVFIIFYKDWNFGTWTNVNGKRPIAFLLEYEF